MDNDKRIISKEDLLQTLDRTITWIENCDTKASIIFGGIGVIFGILLATDYVKKIVEIFKHMMANIGFWAGLHICICTLSIGAIVIGTSFLLRVLIAKADTRGLESKGVINNSLIFFSSIAKNKSFESYKSKMTCCDEMDYCDDIISQIYICSLICDKKFRNYKWGLILSISGFALFAVMMIIGALALS